MQEIGLKDIAKVYETTDFKEVTELLSKNGIIINTYKRRWWENGEVFEELVYSLGKVDVGRNFSE